MKISVIIPSYNEEAVVQDCLNSFLAQDYGDYELIIVDGGSTDRTVIIIEKYVRNYQNIKLLFERPRVGPANARNIGLKASNGDVIIFKDVDTVIEDFQYLRKIAEPFYDREVEVVYSKVQPILKTDKLLEKIGFYMQYGNKKAELKEAAFRKRILDKVGGYDATLGFGDDLDLSKRVTALAPKVGYAKPVRVCYPRVRSFNEFINRYLWYGRTSLDYIRKYPSRTSVLQLILSFVPIIIVTVVLYGMIYHTIYGLICASGMLVCLYGWTFFRKQITIKEAHVVLLLPFFWVLSKVIFWIGFAQRFILKTRGNFMRGR